MDQVTLCIYNLFSFIASEVNIAQIMKKLMHFHFLITIFLFLFVMSCRIVVKCTKNGL